MSHRKPPQPRPGDRTVTLKNRKTGMRILLLIKARNKFRKNGPVKSGRRLVDTNRERIRGMRRNLA